MLKKEIRKSYQQKRQELSFEVLQNKSMLIVYQFNMLSHPPLQYLLSYHPLTEKNEFDITPCQEVIAEKFPGVKIAWPKTNADFSSMEARIVDNEKMFVKNKYNILEPFDGQLLESDKVDMVFVPLLAVDQRGYRVGYGKGFYDKYLAGCRSDTIKIGFSFFDPLPAIDDISDFDVPLNFCITPTRIYEF